MPLRQLAAVWSSFQLALAGLDRISAVLRARIEHAGAARRAGAGAGVAAGVRARVVQLSRRQRGAARRHVRARAGQDLRAGRPDRRRQDHHGVADGAALRSDRADGCCSTAATSAPTSRRSARGRSASSCRSRSSSPAPCATTSSTATTRYQRLLERADRRAADANGTSTACCRGSSRGSRPR